MSAAFHDVSFPLALARGASGGPERRTEIVALASGQEERNAVWAYGRRHYDVGTALRGLDDLHAVLSFFEARAGRLHAFRFRDPVDFKSCAPSRAPAANDQRIGTGNGTQTVFNLQKLYGDRAGSHARPIIAPVVGSVVVAVGNAATTPTINHSTGAVTFATPPANGAAISAGFLFDTIVRFDSDRLDTVLDAFGAGHVVSIGLIEVI